MQMYWKRLLLEILFLFLCDTFFAKAFRFFCLSNSYTIWIVMILVLDFSLDSKCKDCLETPRTLHIHAPTICLKNLTKF